MTLKEKLLQEISDSPEFLLEELLDFLLFLKERHIHEQATSEEAASIHESKVAYEIGDYITLEDYEARQS